MDDVRAVPRQPFLRGPVAQRRARWSPTAPSGWPRWASTRGKPTAAELSDMRSMVAEAMSAGAVGFSTGLEYSPGRHADEDELAALAEVSARHGGIYASHIRERADNFVAAVEEALNIARQCRPARPAIPPRAKAVRPRGRLRRGASKCSAGREIRSGMRIGIDTFPDPWGPAHLLDLAPPWVYEGPEDEVLARLRDPETAEQVPRPLREADQLPAPARRVRQVLPIHLQRSPRARGPVAGGHLAGVGAGPGADRLRAGRCRRRGLPERADPPHLRQAGGPRQAAARPVLQRRERRRRRLHDGPAQIAGRQPVQLRLRPAVHTRVRPRPGPLHRRGGRAEDDLACPPTRPSYMAAAACNPAAPPTSSSSTSTRWPTTPPTTSPQAYPSGINVVAVNGQIVVDNATHTGATPGQAGPQP